MPANPLKMLKLKSDGFQFIQEIPIAAPPKKVWKSVLNIGKWFMFPQMQPSKHVLEAWPGGRWHEEEKDGSRHLHAFVARLEPERLLRLNGPMGMTHLPVSNVMIFELQPTDGGKTTLLRFCQRTYGLLTPDIKKKMSGGWNILMSNIKVLAEKR